MHTQENRVCLTSNACMIWLEVSVFTILDRIVPTDYREVDDFIFMRRI